MRAGRLLLTVLLCGCSSNRPTDSTVDLTNAILTERSADCADYEDAYTAMVRDVQAQTDFASSVVITKGTTSCTLTSNSIPNHDFDDVTADFATPVKALTKTFTLQRAPTVAATTSALTQMSYNAVLLNGVVLDLLSAGCYRPTDAMADPDGNVAIGCQATDPWLVDPLGPGASFGTDAHNAHTQPDGRYHYHGNPMALFDDQPGAAGSPVIGFAADGFPIFGSYFRDGNGTVRKAVSGYRIKMGTRPS
jgi:hypothetical protein